MKIYLIIIKLTLFPYILFCQGIISSDLSAKMMISKDETFLPVIIGINDDFSIINLKTEFHNNHTPIKKRASIICKEMQAIAVSAQTPILDIIKAKHTDYKQLKSSWIINSIFLHAKKSLIEVIADHPNVKTINLKSTKSDIIDYIDYNEHPTANINNGTEPGIEAINVRPLWEMGYTGAGMLVFNYDTGVWPEHPAFKEKFLANHYPMNQCWDGHFSDSPNGHVSDHGTHTLGTMTGLVQETNDTIGIAYHAI